MMSLFGPQTTSSLLDNIPVPLKSSYTDFKLTPHSGPASYLLYEAKTLDLKTTHMIRVLDSKTCNSTLKNYLESAISFVQELLHLQLIHPGSVVAKSFGMCEEDDGKQMFCATLPEKFRSEINTSQDISNFGSLRMPIQSGGGGGLFSQINTPSGGGLLSGIRSHSGAGGGLLSHLNTQSDGVLHSNTMIQSNEDIFSQLTTETSEYLLSDANILSKPLGLNDIIKSMKTQKTEAYNDKDLFPLANLPDIDKNHFFNTVDQTIAYPLAKSMEKEELHSLKYALEQKALGLWLLQQNQIETKSIEAAFKTAISDSDRLKEAIKAEMSTVLGEFAELRNLITELLTNDIQLAYNVKELEIKSSEELRRKLGVAEYKEPEYLAWATVWHEKSEVRVIDWKSREECSQFEVSDQLKIYRNQVKGISNLSLLCSLTNYIEGKSSLQIFDITRKGQGSILFSELTDSECLRFAVNAKRNLIAALPLAKEVEYILYNVNPSHTSNTQDIVRTVRKSKSHKNQTSGGLLVDALQDIDFNSEGKRTAIIKTNGCCYISDVDTNEDLCSIFMNGEKKMSLFSAQNWCRWGVFSSENLVFGSFKDNELNVYDVEKQSLYFRRPIQLNMGHDISSPFEVCPINGNLFSAAATNKVRIYDCRTFKLARSFEVDGKILASKDRNVIWSPKGDTLAASSKDGVIVIEFRSGQVLYRKELNYEKSSVCFL